MDALGMLGRLAEPLRAALDAADRDGWSEVDAPIASLVLHFEHLNLTPMPPRPGAPEITVLTPIDANVAHPNSLSGQHGTGRFPLHTDGAHLEHVPEFVLLEATGEGDALTPTLLHAVDKRALHAAAGDAATNGMFLVRNGRNSFYAPALSAEGVRYDPGCMLPADERAERVMREFARFEAAPVAHQWEGPGRTLVIANRKALHGREEASGAPTRELTRVMLRRSGA